MSPRVVTPLRGYCQLCGEGPVGLVLDHDHSTGAVRGAICRRCNARLARVDREGWERLAVAYVQSPPMSRPESIVGSISAVCPADGRTGAPPGMSAELLRALGGLKPDDPVRLLVEATHGTKDTETFMNTWNYIWAQYRKALVEKTGVVLHQGAEP